jgi:hypothetical protein
MCAWLEETSRPLSPYLWLARHLEVASDLSHSKKLERSSERLLARLSEKLDKTQPLRHLRHVELGLNVLVGRKVYQNYWMHSTARKSYCVASVGDLDSLKLRFHYRKAVCVGPLRKCGRAV